MTNIVSNNAAAVIGTPIAIGIAQQLQVDPEPFILAVLFGANMSYATPFGYQSNLLILSAGGYKFSDFLRDWDSINFYYVGRFFVGVTDYIWIVDLTFS